MSENSKAVFLSYASQDAEAARRICDTLRAEGVEVWFDADGGLEHGDEWDAKIRRQIKECVLFIPLISANTQAREEGYFRLEWDLAAERARTIASGVPFILPVVIDDTREPDALVPDRFRMVQWTRLPGGVVTPEVKARYLKLWSHRTGLLKSKTRTDSSLPAESPTLASTPPNKARWPLIVGIGAAVVAAGIGVFVAMRPAPTPVAAPKVAKSPAPPAAPAPSKRYASSPPEVAALLMRVQAMTDKTDVARAELETALSLLDQAAKLDPADANVWAERALVETRYIAGNLDVTQERKNSALQHARQATSLDPKNPNARLADALTQRIVAANKADRDAATAIVASLVAEDTDRVEAYLVLAGEKRNNRQIDEAFALLDRAAQLPDGAGRATLQKALLLFSRGDWPKATAALDQALAVERSASALLWKSYFDLTRLGDVASAKKAIADIPSAMLTEDFPASGKLFVALWARDWDTAIATMRAIPRNYLLDSAAFSGPTGYYIGYALDRAGRKNAAEVEWRSALDVVNKRLEGNSRSPTLFAMKALLLAALGDRAGGEKTLQTLRELYPTNWDQGWSGHMVAMTLLPPEEAIALLAKYSRAGIEVGLYGNLKLDPFLDHLRSHPKFVELLAKAEADPKLNPAAAPAAANPKTATERPARRPAATAPSPGLATEASAKVDAKSVAVLAFENLSDDKDNEFFSDGISEELTNALSRVPGLTVRGRTSAFFFKGRSASAQEIGEKLSVAYLVRGSVRKLGSTVRITAQLSRAATDELVWASEPITRELKDVFAVQDEIVRNILTSVKGSLIGDGELPRVATTKIEAYTLFLQAQGAFAKRGDANLREAIRLFDAALAIDPNYVPALVGLAQTRSLVPLYASLSGVKAREQIDASRKLAQRALELDPRNAGAHTVIGWLLVQYEWQWSEGVAAVLRARDLAPNDAWIWNSLGDHYRYVGDLAPALAAKRRAWELDPLSAVSHWDLAYVYIVAGQPDEALRWAEKCFSLAPHNLDSYTPAILAAAQAGRLTLMRELIAKARQNVRENEGTLLLHEAKAALLAKDTDEARRKLAAAANLAEQGDFSPACVGFEYLLLGDAGQAATWLRRAYEQRDPAMVWNEYIDFEVIARNPATRPILDQPGLKELWELRRENARAGRNKL